MGRRLRCEFTQSQRRSGVHGALEIDRNAVVVEVFFRLVDREGAEVEHGGGEDIRGATLAYDIDHVAELAATSGCGYGN